MKVKTNQKDLILFTASFPYGNGETFLESELSILSVNFGKIIIICSDVTSANKRGIPSNVSVIRKKIEFNKQDKFRSIINVLSIDFIKELFNEWQSFGFFRKRRNLNYLMKSWYKSKLLSSYIVDVLKENNILAKNTCLYSYWWLDEAIGVAQFKKSHPEVIAFSRCHGYDVYTERSAGNYLPLKRFLIKHLDHVFAISDNAMEYISERFIENDLSKVSVSKLGVKVGQLKLNNVNSDTLVVVSCSAIYSNKRVDLILESILKTNCQLKWVHFGGMIKGFSDEYFESIMNKVRANNNQNIEIVLKGNVSNRNVLEYYANNSIDLFLNLSESEGIPVSIMEALSYSIPVFATNVGGVPEIVNESNGELLEVNISALQLAAKLEDYFTLSLEDKNKLRKAAFESYSNYYCATKNYLSFVEDVYKLKKSNE